MAFIEIPCSNTDNRRCRTFNLRSDSSARTLQDLKFPERGGGFGYNSGNEISSSVRNRFLYWRYCNGSLEIHEESLDTALRSSSLKFIFSNTCILHAEAFERLDNVQMLVCTAGSAVRLVFPHPHMTMKEGTGVLRSSPSIFHTVETPHQDVVEVRGVQQAGQLRCATSHVRRSDGAALFAFCLATGSVILVEMPAAAQQGEDGNVEGARVTELRQASMMSKLWSGIVPTFVSRGDGVSHDTATDALFLDEGKFSCLLTMCRDHRLRVWNVEKRELTAVIDVVDCLDIKLDSRSLQMKNQGHSLRRSQGGNAAVGVHLNFDERSFIVIFAVNDKAPDLHSFLLPVRRLTCDTRHDVVDWALMPASDAVWLLCQSQDGFSLVSRSLREAGGPQGAGTSPALLLDDVLWTEEEVQLVSETQDVQEATLDAVFTPGRFSALAINKAVTALRDSCHDGYLPTEESGESSQEEIIRLVESKISDSLAEASALAEMTSGSVAEEEEEDVRISHWSNFFLSVLQYHRSLVSRPVGLTLDPNTGLVALVRRASLSLFRRADSVEVVAFAPLTLFPATVDASCAALAKECRFLLDCVGTSGVKQLLNQLEMANNDPEILCETFLSQCLNREHQVKLTRRLAAMENLSEAFLRLVEIAEDLQDTEDLSETSEADAPMETFSHPERFLFSSPLAVELLARSADVVLTARLQVSLSLLLLHQLAAAEVGDLIRTRVVNLVRNLVLMRWLASARLCQPSAHTLERITPQLALLDARAASVSAPDGQRPLLDVLYEAEAGERVRLRLRQTGMLDAAPHDACKRLWTELFPVAVTFLQTAICPTSPHQVLRLAHFLLARGQIPQLLAFLRLLDTWWRLDRGLLSHLRGVALLNTGQTRKGVECIRAGLQTEEGCVAEAVLGEQAATKPPHLLRVSLALKVMHCLELLEEPLLVLALAQDALDWLQDDDEEEAASEEECMRLEDAEEAQQITAVLFTAVFKHELALGRSEEAVTALQHNPDPSRRRDCLREFVVRLCERGWADQVVRVEVGELEEELVALLLSRARNVDLELANYYPLVYAFHVERSNFRAAAAVMFELACRIARECNSLSALQHQARALLACLTALRLARPTFRWLAAGEGPLELEEIRKEFLLVQARLRLAHVDQDLARLSAGPLPLPDLVRALVKAGLFSPARRVSLCLSQPLTPVLDGLAGLCLALPTVEIDKALLVEALEEVLPGPGYEGLTAPTLAWQLLKAYLEAEGGRDEWKCVVNKLLGAGHFPPAWLTCMGRQRNPGALLRLFILHDEVEAATNLACLLIDDASSRGGGPGVACTTQRWLPHTWIHSLLRGLRSVSRKNSLCAEMLEKLQTKYDGYKKLLNQAGADVEKMRRMRSVHF